MDEKLTKNEEILVGSGDNVHVSPLVHMHLKYFS